MSTYKWQFVPRFRRNAFGWKSQPPIQRIKEALSEIKLIARKEPVLAAEGATLFLEKLSPSIEQVDSSSGALMQRHGAAAIGAYRSTTTNIAPSNSSCKCRVLAPMPAPGSLSCCPRAYTMPWPGMPALAQ